MAVTIEATPGSPDANSYATIEEADAYFATRIKGETWSEASEDEKAAGLITATRILDSLSVAHRRLIRNGTTQYNLVGRQWTGAPAMDDQVLAWPRSGMRSRIGRAIPADIIPKELKEATSELAWQLYLSDRTLDSEAVVQGISSVTAGSVSVSFKENIEAKILPDIVMSLMPSWWFTDELYETVGVGLSPIFEVL